VQEEMNKAGQDAPGTVPAVPGDLRSGTGVPGSAREGGAAPRRRRPSRRMLAVTAAAAAVTVTAAAGALAALASSASSPPSPMAAVTSAITNTSAQSYSFTLDSTSQVAGRDLRSDVVSGAYDPRHRLGAEQLTAHGAHAATAQIRFSGNYIYTRVTGSGLGTVGKPWNKSPAAGARPTDDPYGFVSDQPVSPAELSGVLQSAGTVRDEGPASGPGWTGTRYTFTARFFDGQESITATVYVDQQERVRRLVTITTQGRFTMSRDLTFGDFGAPVPVTAPAATQVKYTSTPYWGFLY
jgi:hypothetical protein